MVWIWAPCAFCEASEARKSAKNQQTQHFQAILSLHNSLFVSKENFRKNLTYENFPFLRSEKNVKNDKV